jgi:hypothetical protein
MKKSYSKNNFILRLFIKEKRQVSRPTFLSFFTGLLFQDLPIKFLNDAKKANDATKIQLS